MFDGNQEFWIGQLGTMEADGLFDEIIVFNRALSAAEVAEIYNNGISGDKGGRD